MKQEFYSNGKLLLSGEYAILDGALGLAIPTKYGQSLTINPIEEPFIHWKSVAHDETVWFEGEFSMRDFSIVNTTNQKVATTLQRLVIEIKKQNPNFLQGVEGVEAESHLTFPRAWGLGSSSTLINNLAQWGNVDAYRLLWNAFGGSGYDIACARHDTPITYKLHEDIALVKSVDFNPNFKDSLYFVYLNQKQDSKKAIAAYRKQSFQKEQLIRNLSGITEKMLAVQSLDEFQSLMEEHEALLSPVLQQEPIKKRLFSDFSGSVKSLGAWGGDFVLAAGNEDTKGYFQSKGFETIFPYSEMIL